MGLAGCQLALEERVRIGRVRAAVVEEQLRDAPPFRDGGAGGPVGMLQIAPGRLGGGRLRGFERQLGVVVDQAGGPLPYLGASRTLRVGGVCGSFAASSVILVLPLFLLRGRGSPAGACSQSATAARGP